MEYRRLGGSGLRVSEVGLGGNNFGWYCDEAQSRLVIHQALELGVNLIDTADVYGGTMSEEYVGKAIAGRRHDVVVATKLGFKIGEGPNSRGLSYARVISCCEASLRRLGTDYIDLYYLHRTDPFTPLSETLRALDDLMRQGKIRYIGISNFPAWQACETLWLCDRHGYRPPVVTESEYNMLERGIEKELLPFCRAHHVGVIPYSPLASGFLTGKYKAGQPAPEGTRGQNSQVIQQYMQRMSTEHGFATLAALEDFAKARDHTLGELAIAWLLSHPEIPSVIAGATKPEQVTANVAAGAWKLTLEDVRQVEEILGSKQ